MARRQKSDLILVGHVNFTPAARWLKRWYGIRYAVCAYGLDVWDNRTRRLQAGIGCADRVLAISQYTRDRMLAEIPLDPARVALLPCMVDGNRFSPKAKPDYLLRRFRLRRDQPVVLTVSRLAGAERYKGYDTILRALPSVRKVVPDVRYILGGSGPDRHRIEALVTELGLETCVVLAGYVPDHELCDFYNLCDVFTMPSKGEGFGIVFLEALACGKPVLAGNKDGSVDALLRGELGVLVDPDNVNEIADGLSAILTRRHPLAILNRPDELHARVIEAYGYERFRDRVGEHLVALGLNSPRDGLRPCPGPSGQVRAAGPDGKLLAT